MEPQPHALEMQHEMMHEIESNKPEYLVFVGNGNSWDVRPKSDLAIFNWFNEYAGKFYERVGVMDQPSWNKVVFVWDDAAKNYSVSSEPYILLYRLKFHSQVDTAN
jgi:hypothetical protein